MKLTCENINMTMFGFNDGGSPLPLPEDGHFDPRLIDAAVKMIRDRWGPKPFPDWVTFVPSHQHPSFVPDFANQLAAKLGLPCIDVVKKIRKNGPQKAMENSDFRCMNLDGVFEIESDLPKGTLLLIDDAFDSGWTFAVIAALLREAGSGSIFPFAVMCTSTSS